MVWLCTKNLLFFCVLFIQLHLCSCYTAVHLSSTGIHGKEHCDQKVSPCIHCTRKMITSRGSLATEAKTFSCNSTTDPQIAVFVDVSGRKDAARYTACVLPCALHHFFESLLSVPLSTASEAGDFTESFGRLQITPPAGEAEKISSQGLCQACSCTKQIPLSHMKQCLLVSVPRSGNTWMRKMLEDASGVPTLTVFGSEKINGRKSSEFRKETFYDEILGREVPKHFTGEKVVFDAASDLYVAPCGVLNDCHRVRRRSNQTHTIVKTHSPFLPTSWARDAKCIGSDVGKVNSDPITIVCCFDTRRHRVGWYLTCHSLFYRSHSRETSVTRK